MIPTPQQLKLQKTLEFVSVPEGKMFPYRRKIHQVIEIGSENEYLFRNAWGPFVYAITDAEGKVRYVGKSWEKHLYQRWIRPNPYIRHKESRDYIISEIIKNGSYPALWSQQIEKLKVFLPNTIQELDNRTIAKGLEALWIDHWMPYLWNSKREALVEGFTDGEYWTRTNF